MAGNRGCGFHFIYDGIPSEIYGISLVFIDQDFNFVPSGSGIELQLDQVSRSPEKIILGEVQSPVLEFPITIFADEPMDVFKQIEIKNWEF